MQWPEFWLILGLSAACNAACRVLPLYALANKPMPEKMQQALRLIPAACFAALVANDLFDPVVFYGGMTFRALLPYIAAFPVVVVSLRTRSLFIAILVGLSCYALLFYLA